MPHKLANLVQAISLHWSVNENLSCVTFIFLWTCVALKAKYRWLFRWNIFPGCGKCSCLTIPGGFELSIFFVGFKALCTGLHLFKFIYSSHFYHGIFFLPSLQNLQRSWIWFLLEMKPGINDWIVMKQTICGCNDETRLEVSFGFYWCVSVEFTETIKWESHRNRLKAWQLLFVSLFCFVLTHLYHNPKFSELLNMCM